MSEAPLFSKGLTLGLACLLLIPAGLAALTPLEPFPAVMLPGSGNPLDVRGGAATFNDFSLSGREREGKLKRLVVSEVIDPIPDHYIRTMMWDGFGLSNPKPVELKLGTMTFLIPRRAHRAEDRAALVTWLKARLRELGVADDVLVVRRDKLLIELASGNELRRKTRRENLRIR